MRALIVAVTVVLATGAHADACNEKVSACLEEGSACSAEHPGTARASCMKKAKACIRRVDECPEGFEAYLIRLLDCAETGRSFQKCRKTVKMK